MSESLTLSQAGHAPRWFAPGHSFQERPVCHDEAYQAPRLKAAGVDPALYPETCETGLFGLDCFASMTHGGLNIDGYVFLAQSYRRILPTRLGEPLTITGHVRELLPVQRGQLVHEIYRFTDAVGRVHVETELTGLLADPLGADASLRSQAPRLPRRQEFSREGWTCIQEKQVTPDDVRTFSEDVGNDVHFDVDFALRYGFRAPLAQGIMSAVWLLSGLPQAPDSSFGLHVAIRYLRPVFWDDFASLWIRRGSDGEIDAVESRNREGKVTADLRVLPPATSVGADGSRP